MKTTVAGDVTPEVDKGRAPSSPLKLLPQSRKRAAERGAAPRRGAKRQLDSLNAAMAPISLGIFPFKLLQERPKRAVE